VKLLKVEEVEELLSTMKLAGMVMVVMEVTQLEAKDLVEEVTVMDLVNLVALVEVEVEVVIDLTIHRTLELVDLEWFEFNILEVLEETMVIIGDLLLFIYIMVVILYTLIVNYGTLRTGK
jgi:hypothetical protein